MLFPPVILCFCIFSRPSHTSQPFQPAGEFLPSVRGEEEEDDNKAQEEEEEEEEEAEQNPGTPVLEEACVAAVTVDPGC